MKEHQIGYVAFLWKPDQEGGDYGITFPDFPGCVSGGKSESDALQNAKEALIFHMEGMIEDKEEIPEPSSLAKAVETEFGAEALNRTMAESLQSDYAPVMMYVQKPSRQIRFNVLASAAELAVIDRLAAEKGVPRSRFLVETVLSHQSQD